MQNPNPIHPSDQAVNILLVDDEAANLLALEAVLDDPCWRLVRANSGEEALMALVADEFACLLLDVQMPGMSGFELARLVAGRRKSARTPIIFLTAHCQEEAHALEGYASGAVDYVHKPFHPAVLRHKVELFAELHRTHRELQRRADERDDRLAAAAQEAEQRRDKFLAMLAHELRNPLAPISNAVQIIRGQTDPQSRIRWACDIIGRQAGQMTRLVDDLLDVARLVEGKVALHDEAVLLATVMERALESCAQQLEQRQQPVVLDLPAEAVEIRGDTARLVQAFSNLIANASKFSAPGAAISLRATCAGGEVRVALKDAGTGIAPEFLPHVFDLFAQGEQSLDRPQGGLGVGLTLVRQVIELHGGRVVARSDGPGRGTEMLVHLPARLVAGGAPERIGEARAEAPPTCAADDAPVRVLVVDDERTSAETLMAVLEIKGFEVRIAHDGLAALDVADAFQPDVVLLDIGLPGLDGFAVAQRLRSHPRSKDALLIALTGYGDAEARSRSARAGFDSHMTKPADLDRLLPMLADPPATRRARPG